MYSSYHSETVMKTAKYACLSMIVFNSLIIVADMIQLSDLTKQLVYMNIANQNILVML